MKIKKSNYAGVKAVLIELKTDADELDVYFSYETVIAFRLNGKLFICKNNWKQTTGKHLNAIYLDKSVRIPHEQLMSKFESLCIASQGLTFDVEIEI